MCGSHCLSFSPRVGRFFCVGAPGKVRTHTWLRPFLDERCVQGIGVCHAITQHLSMLGCAIEGNRVWQGADHSYQRLSRKHRIRAAKHVCRVAERKEPSNYIRLTWRAQGSSNSVCSLNSCILSLIIPLKRTGKVTVLKWNFIDAQKRGRRYSTLGPRS